jgi:histidine triad (HIT) family protein
MSECLFCKILNKEIPAHVLYEDDQTLVFLDIFPVTKGHALVIPKNHAENLTAGSVEDAQAVMKTVHDVAPRLVKALGGTGYNLGMNHGVDAGQEVFHTHVHVMPRFAGLPRTFEKTSPSQEDLAALADEIRAKL